MDKNQIKTELQHLIEECDYIYFASIMTYDKNYFANEDEETQYFAQDAYEEIEDPHGDYYIWYGKACKVIQILAPDNLQDFKSFFTSYIQGWLINPKIEHHYDNRFNNFESRFRTQRRMLNAIARNADHALFNLESEIQYGFSKSEIDIAKELKKNKHLREAGVIAGLVIELHLKNVAKNRNIKLPKNPQMKHYNEKLKGTAYDATMTKRVELCANIRNKCAHASDNPPTDDEIDTIISSAEIIIATVNSQFTILKLSANRQILAPRYAQ